MCTKEKRCVTILASYFIPFPRMTIFDPMIMMVQKLIKKLINFLGPREKIGSPS
jgi:hypothetical protein